MSELPVVVIGAGGGGIPVVRSAQGDYQSVDAVIDKDLSTALLAREIHADILAITTGVEKVCIHFGQPRQQALGTVNISDMTRYMQEGHFPAGSMLPKIVASLASKSIGPGTRANLDEFTYTTSNAIEVVGKARKGKALAIINPADPPMMMRNTISCLTDDEPDQDKITASVLAMFL